MLVLCVIQTNRYQIWCRISCVRLAFKSIFPLFCIGRKNDRSVVLFIEKLVRACVVSALKRLTFNFFVLCLCPFPSPDLHLCWFESRNKIWDVSLSSCWSKKVRSFSCSACLSGLFAVSEINCVCVCVGTDHGLSDSLNFLLEKSKKTTHAPKSTINHFRPINRKPFYLELRGRWL